MIGSVEVSLARKAVASATRVVVKVGSSSLTTAEGGLDPARLDALVDALAARRAAGSQVVLVSSGAIAAGLAPLGLTRRPKDLATQQAAASVGQLALAHAYGNSFGRYSLTVGQVLLTADDVVRRSHYRNAQRTFSRLLALGVVPVVNENDTVATEEIRFGDNDRLAALVAHLVGADALFLLSDVDALYDGDPRLADARRVTEVGGPDDVDGVRAGTGGALGTGGMASKLAAATLAASAGIPVLLAGATDAARALGTPTPGTPTPGTPAVGTSAPGTHALETPDAGTADVSAPALGTRALGTPALGTADVDVLAPGTLDAGVLAPGTPAPGIPDADTPDPGTPALGIPDVGTAFAATGTRLTARRFWLGYAADANGTLVLDDGAVAAVVNRRRSLLAAGITAVEGTFEAGDVVELANLTGQVVARGVVAYDAAELPALIGRSSHELPAEHRREVVHADDLVSLHRP